MKSFLETSLAKFHFENPSAYVDREIRKALQEFNAKYWSKAPLHRKYRKKWFTYLTNITASRTRRRKSYWINQSKKLEKKMLKLDIPPLRPKGFNSKV